MYIDQNHSQLARAPLLHLNVDLMRWSIICFVPQATSALFNKEGPSEIVQRAFTFLSLVSVVSHKRSIDDKFQDLTGLDNKFILEYWVDPKQAQQYEIVLRNF